MSVYVKTPQVQNLWDASYAATADLSNSQFAVLAFTANVSSGEATVGLPSGSGVRAAGVLQNSDAKTTVRAVVRKLGDSQVIAGAAFNAGAELMIGDATGKVITATGAGAYVVAIARQAATAVGQIVDAELIVQYKV